jgi:hypothetical protein
LPLLFTVMLLLQGSSSPDVPRRLKVAKFSEPARRTW